MELVREVEVALEVVAGGVVDDLHRGGDAGGLGAREDFGGSRWIRICSMSSYSRAVNAAMDAETWRAWAALCREAVRTQHITASFECASLFTSTEKCLDNIQRIIVEL